jgi:Tfp pilus assembly protein PilN
MIKINLLTEKKRKQIPVPIGGIVVVLWAVFCAAGVMWQKQNLDAELIRYRQEKIGNLEARAREVDNKAKDKRRLDQELNHVETALSDYQGILSRRTGSWTRVLRRFEEFVARAKTVWLTQLRVDPEGQVQLSGLSMGAKVDGEKAGNKEDRTLTTQGVTDFIRILQQATDAVDSITLSEVQHDQLDKQAIAKFELTFVIAKD